jgi:hypothetical protein
VKPPLSGPTLALGALLALAGPAAAQTASELQRAKESFQAGAAAYAAGEYLAAIQALDAAYALTPVPAIAFSMAQAERRQYFAGRERRHLDRAITLYRRYLEQVPTGGRRADALDALSQLEPLAALQAGPGAGAEAAAAEPARPTRLMITAEAPGARLAIDGGAPSPSPVIREVAPGKHRIEVTAAGHFPETREVTAVAGELIPVTVTLREQPSILRLSAPAEAELYLDGVFLRRGGEAVSLSLPSGPHRLAVAENGHRVAAHSLQLQPGQTQQHQVTLLPTGQRRAARLLFIAGGATLVGGSLLGALSLRAQGEAQRFLDKRERGSVTSGELEEYDEAITRRNGYRMAAAVGLGVTSACLITGFFLYEFDRPSPEQLQQADAAARAPQGPPLRPTSARPLRLLPLAGADRVGAVVHARF